VAGRKRRKTEAPEEPREEVVAEIVEEEETSLPAVPAPAEPAVPNTLDRESLLALVNSVFRGGKGLSRKLERLEEALLDEDRLAMMSTDDLTDVYRALSDRESSVLKFVSENMGRSGREGPTLLGIVGVSPSSESDRAPEAVVVDGPVKDLLTVLDETVRNKARRKSDT